MVGILIKCDFQWFFDESLMAKLDKKANIGRNQVKIGPILMKICPQGDFDARNSNLQSDFYDSLNLGLFFSIFKFPCSLQKCKILNLINRKPWFQASFRNRTWN